MNLFLKHPDHLDGKYFFVSDQMFAITDRLPQVKGLCEEYEIIQKIRENKEHFFDFSKSLIDIGAEDGNYAMLLNFNKNYCFEPNKKKCSLIWTNMWLKNKIENTEVYNIALGDTDFETVIFNGFAEPGDNNNFLYENSFYEGKEYTITKRTLDSFGIENVGLIKTDTEGFDYFVLKGGLNTIINNNYPPILFECWDVGSFGQTQEGYDRMMNFLTGLGYEILKNWGDVETHLAIKKTKNCLFTLCDDKFTDFCGVMITSFLYNNKWFNGDIIVVYKEESLSQENINKLQKISNLIKFHKIIERDYENNVFDKAYQCVHPNLKNTFYKFEIFRDFFIEKYDKCLFLDSDVIVTKDIKELFETDCDFGWCKEYYSNTLTENGGIVSPDYFNSGVFIFNCKKIHGNDFLNLLFNFIKNENYTNNFKRLGSVGGVLGDQDVLNELVFEYFKNIAFFDNKIYNFRVYNDNPDVENLEIMKNAKIFHIIGGEKFDNIKNCAFLPCYEYYKYYYLWEKK